jgi:hypothetical protein
MNRFPSQTILPIRLAAQFLLLIAPALPVNAFAAAPVNPAIATSSGLSPSSAQAGGGDFHLTISGTTFTLTTQVQWNGVPLSTTYQSPTVIVGIVPAEYLVSGSPSTAKITVIDPKGSDTPSNEVDFSITAASAPEGVDLTIGIGSRVGGQGVRNYALNSSSNTLQLTNFGNSTPQLLAGISLPFCIDSGGTETPGKTAPGRANVCGKWPFDRLAAFVSVQFASGSPETIAGYTLGASYHVSKYLHFMVGYSLAPIQEISPGFAAYAASKSISNFDGASITGYTGGSPTTVHYRGGLFVGIALPLSLKSLLSGSISAN